MRKLAIIITLLATTAIQAQSEPNPVVRHKVDSLEKLALSLIRKKSDSVISQTWAWTSSAMALSRQADYPHGIAVALACQAVLVNMQSNDFARSEQLARQSLDWFKKTNDRYGITVAYYALGFSLFAQSHYDEALCDYDRARLFAREAGNTDEEIFMLSLAAEAYQERGDYGKAFDILQQCIGIAEENKDVMEQQWMYQSLAGLFIQIEDYNSANKYFQMGYMGMSGKIDPWDLLQYAELLSHQHKYDSALFYYGKLDSAKLAPMVLRTWLVSKGEYYLCREDYGAALPYFQQSIVIQRRLNDRNQTMRCLQDLAKAYLGLHEDAAAAAYAREELTMASTTKAKKNIRDGYQIFYTIYDRKARTDSAYFYYRNYISMRDSIMNDQVKGRFASFHFEQKIRYLRQAKDLSDAYIRQQNIVRNLLIGGMIVLLLAGFISFRYVQIRRKNEAQQAKNRLEIQRLEGERAKAALQQRAKELEVQALRSQMNPHFIFNCLNAINYFILNHETEAASDYLTKFSRLMRMIMNHSRHSLITLGEELEVLRLYMDMERLRFKDAFDYEFILDDDIDETEIHIPPLLLQPFVENAIWHGLLHKQQRGLVSIEMSCREDMLTCIIQDNGIGRKQAAFLKSKSVEKHKSMGLQITAERMALLSGAEHFFRIEDLYDSQGNAAGTKVILNIRLNSPMAEPVEALN